VEPKGESDERDDLFVTERALDDAVRFSSGRTDREVGGVLLGGRYIWEGREFVVVERFLKALHVRGGPVSLTFTHDTFAAIWQAIASLDPDAREGLHIVGWHHTHPGLGVFLSSHDLFIQRNFFPLPWQMALVVDPLAGTLGFFRWRDGDVAPGGFLLMKGRG
jgi:proteasome lid subunit RPN8/RPN11